MILQLLTLGTPWPTVDPFLFCVHHVDAYPRGDGRMGPVGSRAGREVGADFAGIDGWRMYHGDDVPGFPQHPHRGFETVTSVRAGLVDHSDSLGVTARSGRGDVQWLTAGRGVVHAETFPLVDEGGPNPLELFQIWLNLPAADKLAEPHFAVLWDADVPRVAEVDEAGRTTTVTVIAGCLGDAVPPAPPPSSYASRPDADVAIWHATYEPGARWTVPAAADGTMRALYVFAGGDVTISAGDGAPAERIPVGHGAVVDASRPGVSRAPTGAEVLVLSGRPIGEPVAQMGPFVMNDRAGLEQAVHEYRATGFGGWPWPTDEPVHPAAEGRFVRRPDGTVERPPGVGVGRPPGTRPAPMGP